MSNINLADKIYLELKRKGAKIANAYVGIIEGVLDAELARRDAALVAARALFVKRLISKFLFIDGRDEQRIVARCEICWGIGYDENAESITHADNCELAAVLDAKP